jgi:hypothetical protein
MLTIIWYMLERERNEPYGGFDRRLMDVKLKRMNKEGKPLVRIGSYAQEAFRTAIAFHGLQHALREESMNLLRGNTS